MRIAALVLFAACSSGWKQSAPSEPEPDSVTVYASDPAPHVVTLQEPKVVTPGAATIPPSPQPCPATPHATQASIQLSFNNVTTAQVDPCVAADRAIGRLTFASVLAPGGFKLHVSVDSVQVQGTTVAGRVTMRLYAAAGGLGIFTGMAKGATGGTPRELQLATSDVIAAIIEDLIGRSVGATMQRHVAGPAVPSAPARGTAPPATSVPPPATSPPTPTPPTPSP